MKITQTGEQAIRITTPLSISTTKLMKQNKTHNTKMAGL
jgi:hypothetical protein